MPGSESATLENKVPIGLKVDSSNVPARPKPCCVCVDEKTARDECMLMSDNGNVKCAELIQNYKNCMKGYGFEL
ncbi:cysteine alpha-hairpin motif superfamily [Dipodascopsis uninucleata]